MYVPYVYNFPGISIFHGLFQINPLPLLSGAPALVLSFVTLSYVYDEIVHWKRNLFQVSSGSTGKAFVLELSRRYQAYADCLSLESIALKASSVLIALTLQNPIRSSKSKDHVAHLNRRLAL